MGGDAVFVVIAADEPACRAVAALLFPAVERHLLTRPQLRPQAPFEGPLFTLLDGPPPGASVGLVVPVSWIAAADPVSAGPRALLAVADHVNLEPRGPLTGRWPAGLRRVFPTPAHIYQPAVVRACAGPRVYSSGVVVGVVAGVADAERPTRFEARAAAAAGAVAVSDSLVPSAIVAAYHGLRLAACGVPGKAVNRGE